MKPEVGCTTTAVRFVYGSHRRSEDFFPYVYIPFVGLRKHLHFPVEEGTEAHVEKTTEVLWSGEAYEHEYDAQEAAEQRFDTVMKGLFERW